MVRYYVEGNSGFVAEVSEEPGPDVTNYYTNSLTQENSEGGAPAASSQNFAKSLDLRRPSLGTSANLINAPRPSVPARPAPRPFQGFRSQPQPQPQPRPQPQQQPSFISQPTFSGNIIDGGIIDGGIIDGGIIDGGIIDGGIINASFEDNRFSGWFSHHHYSPR